MYALDIETLLKSVNVNLLEIRKRYRDLKLIDRSRKHQRNEIVLGDVIILSASFIHFGIMQAVSRRISGSYFTKKTGNGPLLHTEHQMPALPAISVAISVLRILKDAMLLYNGKMRRMRFARRCFKD